MSEQKKLALRTHLELIHQGPNGMFQQLSKNYYWPNMRNTIKQVYDSCKRCKQANVRRRQLISEFEKRSLQDLAAPRQSYGFDFYGIGGKQPGNILVIVDLCTREVTLRYAKNRDQKTVANIIIENIIFQKGVPLTFRSDNAPELVEGVVKELNTYLGISHVKTGGYNPRGNSICERVNATIGAMLRKCDDDHYNNIKTYLPAMQFAINTTYNSVLNCTPFEAGHGLPARTISQARTDANRIQFNAEEGRSNDDMSDVSSRFDESAVKKIMELAMIFSEHAKTQSEWHRRMSSQKLDQTGKQRKTLPFAVGSKVWYYRPPTQEEAMKTGRKVKHLSHYHGPATVTKQVNRHIYEFTHKGKTYQREQGMLIPYAGRNTLDTNFDHETLMGDQQVQKHTNNMPLKEGEYVIMKDDPEAKSWYLAQVHRILADRVKVHWLTTITPPVNNYANAQPVEIIKTLEQATFLRTWCLERGKGRATTVCPTNSDRLKYVYSGRIPKTEIDKHFLIRNVKINSQGMLNQDAIKLASSLDIPHQVGAASETEFTNKRKFEEHLQDLRKDRE